VDTETREMLERIRVEMHTQFDRVDRRFERVDQQFTRVEKRFEEVDKRFDQVHGRFDDVDHRFEGVEKRLDHFDARFDGSDGRMDSIESRLDALQQGLASYLRDFTRFRLQVDRRFTALDEQLAGQRRDMYGHFDTLYHRMNDVQDEYKMIKESLKRLQGSSDSHNDSIEEFTGELAKLRAGYERINDRLDAVETEIRGHHDA
jgi:chromosome segregation ATPase